MSKDWKSTPTKKTTAFADHRWALEPDEDTDDDFLSIPQARDEKLVLVPTGVGNALPLRSHMASTPYDSISGEDALAGSRFMWSRVGEIAYVGDITITSPLLRSSSESELVPICS